MTTTTSTPTATVGGGSERTVERADRWLRLAGVAYAVAFVLHNGDHLRRGLDASPTPVMVLGTVGGVVQVVAIAAVLTRRSWAPALAASIGLVLAGGIAAVHLLPHWSAFSDAFPGATPPVSPLSWGAAVLEVVASAAFGLAGLIRWRAGRAA